MKDRDAEIAQILALFNITYNPEENSLICINEEGKVISIPDDFKKLLQRAVAGCERIKQGKEPIATNLACHY